VGSKSGYPNERNKTRQINIHHPVSGIDGGAFCLPLYVTENEKPSNTDYYKARRVQNVRVWSKLPLVCWRSFPILVIICIGCMINIPSNPSHLCRLYHLRWRNSNFILWIWSGLVEGDVLQGHTVMFGLLHDNQSMSPPKRESSFTNIRRW
jgi:hypothetical protein